jgi:hypothetical protein
LDVSPPVVEPDEGAADTAPPLEPPLSGLAVGAPVLVEPYEGEAVRPPTPEAGLVGSDVSGPVVVEPDDGAADTPPLVMGAAATRSGASVTDNTAPPKATGETVVSEIVPLIIGNPPGDALLMAGASLRHQRERQV